MAPKAADCKNVHNPNLQCKNDFLPYFDGFFLSLLKVYDHKIIFSWPLWIFGGKITKKNVSLIFYPKIPNPPPFETTVPPPLVSFCQQLADPPSPLRQLSSAFGKRPICTTNFTEDFLKLQHGRYSFVGVQFACNLALPNV